MNLLINATMLSLLTSVAAVPASAVSSTASQKLSNNLDIILARNRRAANQPDMCSQNMIRLTKLGRIAGEIFMSVDDSSLYRRTRNHVGLVNLEQPGIYRSTKLKKNHFIYLFYIFIYFTIFCGLSRVMWQTLSYKL
jgi:hypothetical protein